MESAPHKLDIVGDVHGQLEGLRALGRHLGYRVDDGWTPSRRAHAGVPGRPRPIAGPTAWAWRSGASAWSTPAAPSA